MADTLLDVVKRVARNVGLDTDITEFSYDDETQHLVDYINDGVWDLRDSLPWVPTLEERGTVSLVAGTRLYDIASNAIACEIFNWSYSNASDDNTPLTPATLDYIKTRYQDYETHQGTPAYVYQEDGQLGFYPVPDASFTIGYIYPEYPSRMTSTSATFPYPDNWLRYVEAYATIEYMVMKGGFDPEKWEMKKGKIHGQIYADVSSQSPGYLING